MTFSKIFLASAMMLTASYAAACSSSKAETTVYSNAGEYQKPGASVNYSHNLKSQLSVGETTTFNLSLDESYTDGLLAVSFSTDGDIEMFATSTEAEFDMISETPHDMNVSFTAKSNGRHYINVRALAISPSGESQPRYFSIPVQVGPVTPQKPNENMITLESGDNIIEMEAQEEIK